jgi:hypothetical protein
MDTLFWNARISVVGLQVRCHCRSWGNSVFADSSYWKVDEKDKVQEMVCAKLYTAVSKPIHYTQVPTNIGKRCLYYAFGVEMLRAHSLKRLLRVVIL